jgi:hypothetical protein
MPLFENEEVEALKARVKELEVQCASLRHDADSEWGASATEREALAAANLCVKELETERDVVSDRARLREALEQWNKACHPHPVEHPSMTVAWKNAEAALALASSDASAWLRERERAVAERMRAECSRLCHAKCNAGCENNIEALDLDALLGGGE